MADVNVDSYFSLVIYYLMVTELPEYGFIPRFPPPLHPRRGEGALEQPIWVFEFG